MAKKRQAQRSLVRCRPIRDQHSYLRRTEPGNELMQRLHNSLTTEVSIGRSDRYFEMANGGEDDQQECREDKSTIVGK